MAAPILARLEALPKARPQADGSWKAACPAHEDRAPSLTWTTGPDGRVLVHCHAGCEPEAIVAALGASMAALFTLDSSQRPALRAVPRPKVADAPESPVVRTTEYEVRDDAGKVCAFHVRRDRADGSKEMPWRQADGSWGGVAPKSLPFYGSEHLPEWAPDARIVVCEGERATSAVLEAGRHALGIFGADCLPEPFVLETLRDRHLVLSPDHDGPGRQVMQAMARALAGIAASVQWLEPPADAPKGWDLADALEGAADPREVLMSLAPRIGPVPPEMLSDQTTPPLVTKSLLPFRSARELAASSDAETRCAVRGLLFYGATCELAGPIKLSGKTTFATYMAAAILDGLPFLGFDTTRSAVCYLTEQGTASFREALRRAGLLERDDLSILQWPAVSSVPWEAVVAGAVAECERIGARVLMVDTFSRWAGLRGEGENNAGEADGAMNPLIAAAANHDLAILTVRHERKSGGDVGEAARGSSAIGGAADVLLSLRRTDGNGRPGVRVLRGVGRFDGIPDELVLELTDAGYVSHGDMQAVALMEAREAVLDRLPSDPINAMTDTQVTESTEGARTTVRRVIAELMAEGIVARIGAGKRGDPHRYYLGTEAAFLSDQPSESVWSQTFSPVSLDTAPPKDTGKGAFLSDQTTRLDGQETNLVPFALTAFGDMLAPPAVPTGTTAMVARPGTVA